MSDGPRIVVAGAGAIGCFIGGLLAGAGHCVTLLARPRIQAEIRTHGLTLTDFGGMARNLSPDELTLSGDPTCLRHADIVLVTVKSHDTEDMAKEIARHAAPNVQVISLQNGVNNRAVLAGHLPTQDLRAGLVPFNVVAMGQGCYHRASSGELVIEAGPGDLATHLSLPELKVTARKDVAALQWGKFLLNLNNALNALSGLPLQTQLRDRAWRRLLADQWAEALSVLRAENIHPVMTTATPAPLVPALLRLPTPLFTRIGSAMLQIDPQARSAMAQDLAARRPTEIDALQGEVQRRGQALGRATPVADMVLRVMGWAELADEGLPHLPVTALRAEMAAGQDQQEG
ncbi:Putative 2-dehydropantoate 2-reductase [Sulfitobacter sp. DSM 110093]|uniref:2-dehydropantoate 2-reductase n=1 Tax=Sulfitobacter sp. DSM 110093 TaxID=2883127 RepID=UPI001FAE43FC|nr:2-dehydropantoate 2-reductase [Sulfitobacter sp. DSM 110093]UOA32443.1 Putative 2-dehydropantoate 2-reductase [Sulfitobacter sp. DSM 110093]